MNNTLVKNQAKNKKLINDLVRISVLEEEVEYSELLEKEKKKKKKKIK